MTQDLSVREIESESHNKAPVPIILRYYPIEISSENLILDSQAFSLRKSGQKYLHFQFFSP